MNLVLASKSLRRIEVLTKFGYDFITDVSNADESSIQKEDVKELVMALAKLKAETVAERHPDSIIIGADTLVSSEGDKIGKPKDKDDARRIIKQLLGKTHEVFTGVCIINTANNKVMQDYEVSKVTLRDVSDEVLEKYLSTGVYEGKAGAYNIADTEFKIFIENIEGCRYNIRGTPIEKIKKMMEDVK
jgi:septum formation protein